MVFQGKVKSIAGAAAQPSFFESTASGNFDVSIQLSQPDPRLRPGLSADIAFHSDEKKAVLNIPRLAIFIKDGKHIVYVKTDSGYRAQEVQIESQNESRAAIQGVGQGTQIARIDPTVPRKANPSAGVPGATSGDSL